jgi:hypothetical protein
MQLIHMQHIKASINYISYISSHPDDPNVQRFFSLSLKRDARDKERRAQALANFDAKKLRMIPGTSWYFELEFSGMTTDERPDDKLDIPKPLRKIPEGPP